jgi:hypothetical protein
MTVSNANMGAGTPADAARPGSAGTSIDALADCCCPQGLWGWCPAALPATTSRQRLLDRVLFRGTPAVLYFLAVAGLLALGGHLSGRAGLALDGVASLAAGSWCALNFWRCRQAHCVVSGAGWWGLGVVAAIGAVRGRSLIAGHEQPVFLAILLVALAFECGWRLARGTNAIGGGRARPGC